MGRTCKACGEYKNADNFTPFKGGKNGLYPRCKPCRVPDGKRQWLQKSYKKKMYDRCKTRATKKGLQFTITLDDLPEVPAICPVLKTPMTVPSVDRVDSSKGYVPGNVRIISNRANMLKNDATLEELRLLLEDAVAIGNVQDG